MDDENTAYDDVVEDISSGADALQKVSKGFFPKTFGLFDEALHNYLKPKLTKKQYGNIEKQIKKASEQGELNINTDKVEFEEIIALLEWANGVKDIDPNKYPNTSEKWQEALQKLTNGSLDMLRAIQKISPDTIEQYSIKKTFTLDDAIEFEKLGLGAIQPPKRISIPKTEKEYWKMIGIFILVVFSIVLFSVYLSQYLIEYLEIHEAWIVFGAVFPIIFIFYWAYNYDKRKNNNWFFRKIFTFRQTFWTSHLGAYTLTKVFGPNPNKTILWDISPIEEERSFNYISNNPDINRS